MDNYENEELSLNDNLDENQSEKQTRRSVILEHQLPGKSTYLEKQHKQIIVSYWLQGHRGTKELSYNDFSSNSLGFDNKRVSSNNNFLEEIGIIKKGSKASTYLLTEKGISLAEAFNYKKEGEAKKILATIIKDTWIYESAHRLLCLNENVSTEDIIIELAHDSKADLVIHRRRLLPLIDYLEFAELIEIDSDNNQVSLNYIDCDKQIDDVNESTSETLNLPDDEISVSSSTEPINDKPSIETINKAISTKFEVANPSSSANINVDISISLEITPEMTPDDIKGKLDAVISSLKDKNE